METTPITQFNKENLVNVSKSLHFSNSKIEPVVKHVTFSDFVDISNALHNILEAIEVIGYQGQSGDMAICAGLAGLAKKLLPTEELVVLDEIFVLGKDSHSTPLESLK